MQDISSVFLGPLQKLLEFFQKERHHKDAKKDEALLAIRSALTETQKYIEKSGGTKCFDRETEYRLSQIWGEAAIKARHVSGEIAERLNDKSVYWSDAFQWSSEEVFRKKIDISSLQATVSTLLREA